MAENQRSEGSIHDWENTFDILDIFKSAVAFILVVGFVFGWFMLMLLIISFLTLSYIHFDIRVMFVISSVAAAVAGTVYAVKTVHKYSGKEWKGKRKK